ncbi:MAG: hypothetical protein ACKOV8_00380, partial [Phycisphaerales bacterium]
MLIAVTSATPVSSVPLRSFTASDAGRRRLPAQPGQGDALGAKFEGVLPNLKRRFEESESEFVKERLLAYMSASPCPGC